MSPVLWPPADSGDSLPSSVVRHPRVGSERVWVGVGMREEGGGGWQGRP